MKRLFEKVASGWWLVARKNVLRGQRQRDVASLLFLFLLLTAGVGCSSVPRSRVNWVSASGTRASLDLPKDVKLKGLKLTFVTGPDPSRIGQWREHPVIVIDEYEASTNPEVVDRASAGQARIIKAWKELFDGFANSAAAGFAGKAPPSPAGSGTASGPTGTVQPQFVFVPVPQAAQVASTNAPAANSEVANSE